MIEGTHEEKGDLKRIKFTKLIAEPIPPSAEGFPMTIEKYEEVGFEIPWVEYSFKNEQGQLVGYGGFMGPPKNGEVEIDFILTYDPDLSVEALVAIHTELVEIAYKAKDNIRVFARCGWLDSDPYEVYAKSGFLPYRLPDNFRGDVTSIHKGHLEKFPSLQDHLQIEKALKGLEQPVTYDQFMESFSPPSEGSSNAKQDL